MNYDQVQKELEALRLADPQKMLHAEKVLEWAAAHPKSALFASLEWDDRKAGNEYRLYQVRRLIKITILYDDDKPAMFSLSIDRPDGGGYRHLGDVLSSRQLSDVLLQDALSELDRIRQRYERVEALTSVWRAVGKVKARAKAKGKRPKAKKKPPPRGGKGSPRRRPKGGDLGDDARA
jgi:hypothetical protein